MPIRGHAYDEIASTDPSYLQWIVEKSELEEGIKHSAKHWLASQGVAKRLISDRA